MTSREPNPVFKRAVVYLAWGETFIGQAMASARSVKSMGLPIVLITDEESTRFVVDEELFDVIRVIELQRGKKLDKCALWRHLPEAYDSFVFLDTDTVVLGDVSLGFDKAERHGIAMAPAPNYNLGHHWAFRAAMPDMDLLDRSQLQMNTGVIFFIRRPDVEQVFLKWMDLAVRFDDHDHVASDQPLFTAAMELLDFNPYTLSPSYNYRGMGELAVGPVHVWHSHHPVPGDLNEEVKDWPPRRFLHGESVPYVERSAQRRIRRQLRRLFR